VNKTIGFADHVCASHDDYHQHPFCFLQLRLLEPYFTGLHIDILCRAHSYVVFISFVLVIGLNERAVVASYTIAVPAPLHNQCIGANSQSELVIPNWFYSWFSLYTVPHAHSYS